MNYFINISGAGLVPNETTGRLDVVLLTLWKTLSGDNAQLKNYYEVLPVKVSTNPSIFRMSENSVYMF